MLNFHLYSQAFGSKLVNSLSFFEMPKLSREDAISHFNRDLKSHAFLKEYLRYGPFFRGKSVIKA